MKSLNRDLLLLSKKVSTDPADLELEVELMDKILMDVEGMRNFCIANEIIDVNRYRIITRPHKIEQLLREKNLKPFVFISNKN